MGLSRARRAPRSWPRLPRGTARLRLTALYGGLFCCSGIALVAITYALFERATEFKTPRLPKIPHTPSLGHLLSQPSGISLQNGTVHLLQSPHQLAQAVQELVQAQYQLARVPDSTRLPVLQVGPVRQQLAAAQQKLTSAVHQLALAVHEVSQAGSVQAAQRAADSHELLTNSGIALAFVAVLAFLAGWLVAGRILRPIRTITRTAQRISSTNLHERLALDGPRDELKDLGDTLDALFGRLDAAFEAQRHFVANASHELRTPLTAERTVLQVALDDPSTSPAMWRTTAEEVLASNDEQARLIEALLALASSEGGLNEREPVDLAAAVTAALFDLAGEVDRLGIRVETVTAPASIDGDALLIERLVANLLTNAVGHNVLQGRIEVVTGARAGRAVLSVTNSGPVIPPGEIDRLFEPFQRLDPHRTHHDSGHGLGLSIVRAIAVAHGATVEARSIDEGGVSIEVTFPLPTARE